MRNIDNATQPWGLKSKSLVTPKDVYSIEGAYHYKEEISMGIFKRTLTGVLALVCILCLISPIVAESNVAVWGSAQARLDFRVNLQLILSLRLGSLQARIDHIDFDVNQLPPTAIPGSFIGTYPVPVALAGLIPAGNIIASSPLHMSSVVVKPFGRVHGTRSLFALAV